MRICSIVGARPQFIKLAVICRAVAARGWTHSIIHTGQHYDDAMSSVFFQELEIPHPDHNLGVGSGTHGEQTGEMIKRLEAVLMAERPDWVLLYGDTNSTLAGAVVAAKLGLWTAHIEAGLRSYRRAMPEEINRVMADRVSDLLLCPTRGAMENLRKEGLEDRAILTGDVMYDASVHYRRFAEARSGPLADAWHAGEFALATVHRAENTDDSRKLAAIVSALNTVAEEICPVVWPVHPRTLKKLGELDLTANRVTLIQPVSYLEMLLLEGRARFILTDSGGVQKEAYFLRVPCITLRDETEWVETLDHGCNVLAGCSESAIVSAARMAGEAGPWTAAYGEGRAGELIVSALELQGRRGAESEMEIGRPC
jgi:UDP-GlcNAc3NAcA epimerase